MEMFGKQDVPEFTAILANSLCLFLNITTLFVALELITGYQLRLEKIHSIIGILALLTLNYFLLLHNGRVKEIINEFSSETKKQRTSRTIWCWVYIFSSYLVFLILVLLLSPSTITK